MRIIKLKEIEFNLEYRLYLKDLLKDKVKDIINNNVKELDKINFSLKDGNSLSSIRFNNNFYQWDLSGIFKDIDIVAETRNEGPQTISDVITYYVCDLRDRKYFECTNSVYFVAKYVYLILRDRVESSNSAKMITKQNLMDLLK